jgi:uncharacterized protein YihD (DUF1040 family)
MRDPNRIPVILEAIRTYWEKYPDLRLGQLIDNASYHSIADLFYVEDDVLLLALKEMDAS